MDYKFLQRKPSNNKKYRKNIKYLSLGLIAPTPHIDKIDKLQKQLDCDTSRQNPQTSIIQVQVTEKEKRLQLQKNKYWINFLQKTNVPKDKVLQNQHINLKAKFMDIIYSQSNKLIKNTKNQIEKQQAITQDKYKKSHSFFQQQKVIKKTKQALENQENLQNQKQLNKLKRKQVATKLQIALINQEINKDQKKLKKFTDQLQTIEEDRLNFLRLLLKKGCYRYDGVTWILQQMYLIKYKPTMDDLPQILDLQSKKCLLKQYQNIKKKAEQQQNDDNKSVMSTRSRGNSFYYEEELIPTLDRLINNNNIKKIYTQTHTFFKDWIDGQGWKRKFKKVDYSSLQKIKYKWKQKESKRINECYSQLNKKEVQKIMFGIKSVRKKNQSAHQLKNK